MKMVNKKGELTSKQLVTIIILIVSFVIILIFFFSLRLKERTEVEACRSSLVWKSIGIIGKYMGSIKCKTQDVCFSMGGECGSGDMVEIKIEKTDEVYANLNELALNCWSMTGEGKIKWAGKKDCGICYIVSFDGKVQDKIPVINDKKISGDYIKNIQQNLRTDKPVAIIAFGEKSEIRFLQHTAEDLEEEGCANFPFL